MLASTAAIALTARLLKPIIDDLYVGAKRIGVRGLEKWKESTFPRKLARRIRVIEEVKTIWSPDKEVALRDFYYPSKLLINGKPTHTSKISDLGETNTLIEGTVGQGKSILLRHLAIEEILSNEAKRLPIFLEFRVLGARLSLQQAILRALSTFDIDVDEETLTYLYKSGKIALLLDGYDEIDEEVEKETFQELEYLAQKFPDLLIVATSRPNNSIQRSTVFQTVPIASLTAQDYVPFMGKLGISTAHASMIKDAIRRSPSKLTTLITTPLMLTMVVLVYQSENEIPETLPDFFEKLFHVVFTRHDKLKAAYQRKHYSGLSERRLQTLFEAFCFMSLQNGNGRSLSSSQFSEAFDAALEYTEQCTCELEKFKLDITKVSCLMLDEGLDMTTFLHKSILEYYAAAFIKHSSDEVAALFYSEVLSQSRKWWEVLTFLKDIDPFRYSRDFAIPEAKLIRSDVLSIATDRTTKGLINLIKSTHPDLVVNFTASNDEEQTLTPRSYGPFTLDKYLGLRGFDNYLIDAIDRSIPNDLTKGNIVEQLGVTIEQERDGKASYSATVITIITKMGGVEFWPAIDRLAANIDKQVIDAERIILQQEKRKLIFSRKPFNSK